jgi:hypothetical protein
VPPLPPAWIGYGMISFDGPAGGAGGETEMDSMQDSAPAVAGTKRRRPPLRLAVALVAIVGVVCAVFIWWGKPRLGEGGVVGPGAGMSWANDGVDNTRMVVRSGTAGTVTATFSIRNDGRLPFTVHGLDVANRNAWLSKQQVMFVPGIPGFDEAVTPLEQLTLDPEEQATVLWSLDMACRPTMSEGSFMSINSLPFKVTWFGTSTTRELPLEQPITFVGDGKPEPPESADCY